MDERRNVDLVSGRAHLMPDVRDVLPRLVQPLFVWANTRTAREAEVRAWLARAGIDQFFAGVVTSVDAGARKPDPNFFEFALALCRLNRDDVVFVGNQLNTDIRGGEGFGIRTVWLSGPEYRSADDDEHDGSKPTYQIQRLAELPALLADVSSQLSRPACADSPRNRA